MSRIAFATAVAHASLVDDDLLAVDELRSRGVTIGPAVWSDPTIDWTRFDAVIVRSCWDYHLEYYAFVEWIDRLQASGVALWNPPSVLRWNLDKRYLLDLEQDGVPIVPTACFERGATVDLSSSLAERRWEEAVVKPSISLSAHETWITSLASAKADSARAQRVADSSGLLIQPFLREVQTEGEWSLIYFDRVFSHAVIKLPKSGDFRVQNDHGGTSAPAQPSDRLLKEAGAVLQCLSSDLLYARVDGVVVDGQFLLMELEVIDPSLFLRHSADGIRAFADAIVSRLAQGLP